MYGQTQQSSTILDQNGVKYVQKAVGSFYIKLEQLIIQT